MDDSEQPTQRKRFNHRRQVRKFTTPIIFKQKKDTIPYRKPDYQKVGIYIVRIQPSFPLHLIDSSSSTTPTNTTTTESSSLSFF